MKIQVEVENNENQTMAGEKNPERSRRASHQQFRRCFSEVSLYFLKSET